MRYAADQTNKMVGYVRSTMGGNRLSGLALISGERQFAWEVDYKFIMK